MPGMAGKPDEAALWQAVEAGEWPRNAGRRLDIPLQDVLAGA
jgi:hypothetical protein